MTSGLVGPYDPSIEKVIDGLLTDLGQHTLVTVIAGAAVSIATPSNLPDVKSFIKIFTDEIKKRDQFPTDLHVLDKLERVPFERLMQVVYNVLLTSVPDFIPNFLTQLYGQGAPNNNHRVLIDRLIDQRIYLILTTNFDNLFEKVDPHIRSVVTDAEFDQLANELSTGILTKPTVAHLHGSVTEPNSLIAMMNQVGKPLQGSRRHVLEEVLKKGVLVSVGYSGSDQDIGPILDLFPKSKQWQLVRGTIEPKPLGPTERVVELVPSTAQIPFDISPSRGILAQQLDQLSLTGEANLLKLVGAVCLSIDRGVEGLKRLYHAQQMQWTESAAIFYAGSLARIGLFSKAANVLKATPDDQSPIRFRWLNDRAFYERHTGQFSEVAKAYEALRTDLEQQFYATGDENLIMEIISTIWHEIENLLLMASAQKQAERQLLITDCENLLIASENWINKASQLPPTFELDYYKGEIALFNRDFDLAASSYEKCLEEFTYWIGPEAITLVTLRKIVALRAKGDWRTAITLWRSESWKLIKRRFLVALIQYLVISPILLGIPIGWYWLSRRLAAKLYPVYEGIKIHWLRLKYPDFIK
jgi:tetratricopeptide (TPR) repeat protein